MCVHKCSEWVSWSWYLCFYYYRGKVHLLAPFVSRCWWWDVSGKGCSTVIYTYRPEKSAHFHQVASYETWKIGCFRSDELTRKSSRGGRRRKKIYKGARMRLILFILLLSLLLIIIIVITRKSCSRVSIYYIFHVWLCTIFSAAEKK